MLKQEGEISFIMGVCSAYLAGNQRNCITGPLKVEVQ